MDNKAQIFLERYNTLDELLRRRYDGAEGFSYVARYANELLRSPSYSVSNRGKRLDSLREIRNFLVHDLDMNVEGLLNLDDEALKAIQFEIDALVRPRTVYQAMTPVASLTRAELDDNVPDLFAKMAERGHMQLPVFQGKNRLLGVLSPNALLVYLGKSKAMRADLKLRDMQEVLPLPAHICEHYAFLPRNATKKDVAALYDSYYDRGKKLAMVFVTESGKEDEAILGILTSYDIVHFLSGEEL